MRAIHILLKCHWNDEECDEAIEEIEELQRENTALKITIDRLVIQDIDSSKIYHLEEKLSKAQNYIVELENRLKGK